MGLPVTFFMDNEFDWNTPVGKYRILGSCFYFKLFCNESEFKVYMKHVHHINVYPLTYS